MDNYRKGEVKELEEDPPVFPQQDGRVIMRVSAGSKIRNLMGFAMKKLREPNTKQICWNGCGNAVTKTITCAEILRRKNKGLHQINKIRFHRIEEYWEPKLEGLERLKVNKDIPAISILLSKEPLDVNEPGYQRPGSFDDLWKEILEKDRETEKNIESRSGKAAKGGPKDWKNKKEDKKSGDRRKRKRKINSDNNKEKEKMEAEGT